MSTTKTSETSTSVSKKKESTLKSSSVDPIAEEVKKRYATGLFNINQLASQFMVHTSRIEKILGK